MTEIRKDAFGEKLPFEQRPLLLEEDQFFGAYRLFEALGDEMRLEMLEMMCTGEVAFGELAREFDLPKSQLSYHLKILEGAGAIEGRAEGTRRYYRASPVVERLIRAMG